MLKGHNGCLIVLASDLWCYDDGQNVQLLWMHWMKSSLSEHPSKQNLCCTFQQKLTETRIVTFGVNNPLIISCQLGYWMQMNIALFLNTFVPNI